MGNRDSSHYYSNLAINYIKYQEHRKQVSTYNNIAVNRLDNHRLDEAEGLLKKSLAIKDIPHSHYLLAEFYHEKHDEDMAENDKSRGFEINNTHTS